MGADLLLRPDIRARHGLHRVPAELREGRARARRRSTDCTRRGAGPLGEGDQRSRRRDGRRVLHLRPLRAARTEGDGRDPGRGGAARHAARSPAAAPGRPAPARSSRLVDAAAAGPCSAGVAASPRLIAG